MKRHVRVVIVAALLLASFGLAEVSRAADPTLNMEGTGNLYSTECTCSTTSCGGEFSAKPSGTPFTNATLNLPLSATLLPVAGKGGCATATGTGTLNGGAYSVNFYGQVCSDPLRQWFSLSGTLQIVVHPETAGLGLAASGTLVAGGPIHIPCFGTKSPFPGATAEMLVSILGVAGKIPLLVP